MAEDLGRILIDFGKLGGGGAVGPEPTQTKSEAGVGGFDIATTLRAIMGDPAAIIKMVESVSAAMQFVEDVVSKIRESGRFAPGVMTENAAMQIQQIQQQLREAAILGPLYQMILRWYRELMRLLEPWKLLLSAIFSFLAGAILKAVSAIMSYLNSLLPAILQGMIALIAVVRDYASKIAAAPAMGSAMMAVQFPGLYWLWNQISGGNTNISGKVASAAGTLDVILQQLQQVLTGVMNVANNTAPAPSGADWAATQLREIASRSPLYPKAGKTPTFWNPPGSTYP
jgi:hypothetical protein